MAKEKMYTCIRCLRKHLHTQNCRCHVNVIKYMPWFNDNQVCELRLH